MIRRLRVENFQSLESADVELGGLTVIVGPSNSGKSAMLRALRAVARNAASPDFVTHGKRHATVRVELDEGEVVLERGKALSTYRVLRDGEESVFTKAGTSVPDEVAAVLRMPETQGELLNFAFQFDRPFLLDAPATKVAQVLGELTNVTVILDAVREANRRRLEVASRLKVRRQDLDRLRQEAEGMADLQGQRDEVARQSEAVEALRDATSRTEALAALWTAWTVAEAAVTELEERPRRSVSVDGAVELAARVEGLSKLIAEAKALAAQARADREAVEGLRAEAERLSEEHVAALRAGGRCPLCGAST